MDNLLGIYLITTDCGLVQENRSINKQDVQSGHTRSLFLPKIWNFVVEKEIKIRQPLNKLQLVGSRDRWINTLGIHPYGGLMFGLSCLAISWGLGMCSGGDIIFIVVCVISVQL